MVIKMNGPQAYLIAAVAGVAIILVAYGCGRMDGANSVQIEFDAYRLANAKAVQMAHEQTREVERQAQERITAQKEIDRENLDAIDRKHRASIDRLRQQQASGNGGSGVSYSPATRLALCSESPVAERDGGLVVRPDDELRWPLDYAKDAAELQVALDSCVSQYETIRQAFNP